MKKIKTNKKGTTIRYIMIVVVATFCFLGSVWMLELDFFKFFDRLKNVGTVLQRLMVFDVQLIPQIVIEMLVSMALGVAALIVGTLIALVLSCLAASNVSPNLILSQSIKGSIAVIRAVPALVWVLMVVSSIGFGNTGGMIGLIFPTVGYLTKSFTTTIEEEGSDLVEMMQSTGASWIIMVTKGVLTQSFPKLLSWISIRFEGNIAEGISLGIIGVGGVGLILSKAISKFDYPMVSTTIVVIFIVMFCVEMFTNKLKGALKSA